MSKDELEAIEFVAELIFVAFVVWVAATKL